MKGLEQGRLCINLCPCLPSGKVLNEEQFVDQPDELLGKPYSFQVKYFHLFASKKNTLPLKFRLLDNNAIY